MVTEAKSMSRTFLNGFFNAGTILVAIALGFTIVVFLLAAQPGKTTLTVQTLTNEELTRQPQVSGLRGRYFYQESEGDLLREIQTDFINTGAQHL